MKKTICSAIIIVCLVSLCKGGYADESSPSQSSLLHNILGRGELRAGINPAFLPFEMLDKRGELIGFDIDLGYEIARELGVEFVPVQTSWNGILPHMLEGQFDIILSMTITDERAEAVDFSHSYVTVGQRMLLHPRHQQTITSYQQVNSPEFAVATQRGTTAEQAVRRLLPKATCMLFERPDTAAYSVVHGKADAFVYDLPFCVLFQKTAGEDALILLDDALTTELLAIAIPQGETELLQRLNQALQQLRDDGRYDKLYQKWFLETEWFQEVE